MGERADVATVLAVDDQQDHLDLYEARLQDDYDVRTADSGERALERLDDDVDVVLLDREMPGMSGDDVLDEIRARGYDCHVAIVTAVEPDFDIVDLGFDAYLTKPITKQELQNTIERLLRRHTYTDSIRDLFSLCERRALLLEQKPESELADNDEFQELTERIQDRRHEADELAQAFDREDYRAAFRDLG